MDESNEVMAARQEARLREDRLAIAANIHIELIRYKLAKPEYITNATQQEADAATRASRETMADCAVQHADALLIRLGLMEAKKP